MAKITLNIRKQMQSNTLITVLLILVIGIDKAAECRNINEKSHRSSDVIPKLINQCRAACIEKFLFDRENIVVQSSCQEASNCAMCWDFCETLLVHGPNTFLSICTDHSCVSFYLCNYQKTKKKKCH